MNCILLSLLNPSRSLCSFSFLNNFIYLFIYLWLHWVFVALHGLSLVEASGATLC